MLKDYENEFVERGRTSRDAVANNLAAIVERLDTELTAAHKALKNLFCDACEAVGDPTEAALERYEKSSAEAEAIIDKVSR